MLTIFTTPKPFQGHFKIIQENAIRSWTLLRPAGEIILFGNEAGATEAAAELGIRHISDVTCNEYGTPLLNHLFEQAEHLAAHDVLCYINADIILMNDFREAVEKIAGHCRRFLMIGQRWNVDINESLDFGPGWESSLRAQVSQTGELFTYKAMDYFVFRRGLWGQIHPMAIGRTVWDNWLIYQARAQRAAVIDVTPQVMAIHQNHDYSHRQGGEEYIWNGPEAKRNQQLMLSDTPDIFTLRDATHVLTSRGIKRVFEYQRLRRYFATLPILYPQLRLPLRLFLKIPYSIRARLGLALHSGEVRNG